MLLQNSPAQGTRLRGLDRPTSITVREGKWRDKRVLDARQASEILTRHYLNKPRERLEIEDEPDQEKDQEVEKDRDIDRDPGLSH